jgi:protein PhnA
MSEEMKGCPHCQSPYGYSIGEGLYSCPECRHEWQIEQETESKETELIINDVNGNRLHDGDAVIVIKDLPVKGAPKPVKAGTKIKNIRLRDSEHNIDCKIDGFGSMGLKSEFVKKA